MSVRCPNCGSFANRVLIADHEHVVGWCRCCGSSFDIPLVAGTRRAEPVRAWGGAFQNGPKGNGQ